MGSSGLVAQRRQQVARAWALERGAVLVASGLQVPIAGTDQCHDFHPHPEFRYLAGIAEPASVLTFDPGDPTLLYAGLRIGGVYRSRSGGPWELLTQDVPAGTPVLSLAIAASDPSTIYLGTERHGMFISNDGGAHWSRLPGLDPFDSVQVVAVAPSSPATLFAATHPKLHAFVARIRPSGTAFDYSTFLGGMGEEYRPHVAARGDGSAVVTGSTTSLDFPLLHPFQAHLVGASETVPPLADTFVTRLDPQGHSLLFSTFLGGSDWDEAAGITLDSAGNVYVTGATGSVDFPVQDAFQATHAGGYYDTYVTKLTSSGNALLYSTYLGGSKKDYPYAIVVDNSGVTSVVGETNSGDFPTAAPIQAELAGDGST
ncbi:MAG: hypothetical protein C4321_03935, partial [Chloroflexota bacterium]